MFSRSKHLVESDNKEAPLLKIKYIFLNACPTVSFRWGVWKQEEYLFYHFRTQGGIEKLGMASPGTADRNRTLRTNMLQQILIPVPKITIQNGFVKLLHKIRIISEQYSKVEKELTELIPTLLDTAFKQRNNILIE